MRINYALERIELESHIPPRLEVIHLSKSEYLVLDVYLGISVRSKEKRSSSALMSQHRYHSIFFLFNLCEIPRGGNAETMRIYSSLAENDARKYAGESIDFSSAEETEGACVPFIRISRKMSSSLHLYGDTCACVCVKVIYL